MTRSIKHEAKGPLPKGRKPRGVYQRWANLPYTRIGADVAKELGIPRGSVEDYSPSNRTLWVDNRCLRRYLRRWRARRWKLLQRIDVWRPYHGH